MRRLHSKRAIASFVACPRACRGILFQFMFSNAENQVHGGSRCTFVGRRRWISLIMFSWCSGSAKSHPVFKSADNSPRKPSFFVCS
eukprot:8436028-Lingulodinium_polyedra.AAC.1